MIKNIFFKLSSNLICIFFIFIIRLIRPIFLIKFNLSHSARYGHFVGILSLYISRKEKKMIKNLGNYEFFIHDNIICNAQIEKLFKKKINFFPSFFYPLIKFNSIIPGGNTHIINYQKDYFDKRVIFEHRDVYNIINETNPVVEFNNSDIQHCKNKLKELNISESDKIIILNLRDKNYLKKIYPQKNFNYKTQNVDIDNYNKTINELVNKGYKVIRTGLYHEKKLNINNKNYIDLFSNNIRSDLLETYLISKCIFQIGSFSGGSIAAQFIFRKPSIITNQIPITESHTWSKKMYVIFKKIFDKKRKINITTSEYFELLNTNFGPKFLNAVNDHRYICNKPNKNLFYNYNISDFEIIENNEKEIFDVVSEVLNITKYQKFDNENKENLIFKRIFLKNMENYSILKKFHGKSFNINIGEKFLKDNTNFLN